jgi:hypothetical protein
MAEVFVIVLSNFPHYWVCFTNRFFMSVELSSEQLVRKVGFYLKFKIIIMVWLFGQVVSAIFPLHCHLSYYSNCVMSRMYFTPYLVCGSLITFY